MGDFSTFTGGDHSSSHLLEEDRPGLLTAKVMQNYPGENAEYWTLQILVPQRNYGPADRITIFGSPADFAIIAQAIAHPVVSDV
jgi:hypothetical protein